MSDKFEYTSKPEYISQYNDLCDKDNQNKEYVYSICRDMNTSIELKNGPVAVNDRIVNLGEECSRLNMIHPLDELFQADAFNYLRRILVNSINEKVQEMTQIASSELLSNPLYSLTYTKQLLDKIKRFEEIYNSACDAIYDLEFDDKYGVDLLESTIIVSDHSAPTVQRIITSHEAYHELKQNHKVMDYIQKLRRFY